jgi:catechol 2,3-dioxygenase-like lactoylglutathione lyase family enzyme
MLDHVAINVSDASGSRAFYEAALAPLGYRAAMEPAPGSIGFFPESPSGAVGSFWIHDTRRPVTAGHVAFSAADRATVDAFHAAAVAAGGTDNGAPGPRPYHPNYYGAFVLDPDGVNVEAVCHLPEPA